jgi:cell division septum initiation protein DivIVA
MSRKTAVETLIINHTRRLQKLKEQQALKGYNTDPELLLEIEDIEAQLGPLQTELAGLTDTDEPATFHQTTGGTMSYAEKPKEGGRIINTGGGAYIEGSINTGGGDFVGRDQLKSGGLNVAEVKQLFDQIYARIETRPNTTPEDKADLKSEVQEVQAEAMKGDQADESFLSRRLRHIQRMAPDILAVITAALANPVAGFSAVVTKVAQRLQAGGHD